MHGVPKTIVSGRGTQFVSLLGENLELLRPKLICGLAYQPQMDGQVERVDQILEDILIAIIMHFVKSWDKCLPLVEFSYNNSYQASLKMTQFQALYERRCRTPLNRIKRKKNLWSQPDRRCRRKSSCYSSQPQIGSIKTRELNMTIVTICPLCNYT